MPSAFYVSCVIMSNVNNYVYNRFHVEETILYQIMA